MVRIVPLIFLMGCIGWSTNDTLREGAFGAMMAIDLTQTSHYVASCSESNPIIGECGEHTDLITYFFGTMLLHMLVTDLIPSGSYRSGFQFITLGAEGATVASNVARDLE